MRTGGRGGYGTRAIRRAKRDADRVTERQAEQLRVVQVTMRTVQDIMNNCLNQLLAPVWRKTSGSVGTRMLGHFQGGLDAWRYAGLPLDSKPKAALQKTSPRWM
jgi:hypothetical protein